MAVNHPVTRILRVELYVAPLRYAHEYRVLASPRAFLLTTCLSASHDKLMAVEMDGMVIHSHVEEPNLDSFPLPNDEWSCSWACFSVEREPVEFHAHGVWGRVARQ